MIWGSRAQGDGGIFYNFCRRHGSWPAGVTGGWDPHTEPERFYPYMAEQHVTSDYPPTILVHGTADTDVPYECSAKMAELFGEAGVEHELHTIEVRETFTYGNYNVHIQ
jgi:dipeptidyl aminopeptidase/acylaminoacyl peptidase